MAALTRTNAVWDYGDGNVKMITDMDHDELLDIEEELYDRLERWETQLAKICIQTLHSRYFPTEEVERIKNNMIAAEEWVLVLATELNYRDLNSPKSEEKIAGGVTYMVDGNVIEIPFSSFLRK